MTMHLKPIVLRSPPWVSAAPEDSWIFAELVLAQSRPGQRVLDIGTGTGLVAITLAQAGIEVTATDVSPTAVRVAQANAARNHVSFPCFQSDLLRGVDGTFDLIAFNLPFSFGRDSLLVSVAKNLLRRIRWVRQWFRKGGIPQGVLRFREKLAADLLEQAAEHLSSGGRVMLHVFLSEVETMTRLAPPGAVVEVIHDKRLRTNQTDGLVIRMP